MTQDGTSTKERKDFSAWYNDTVQRAELADYSPVRGSMVIRPWGYAIWELMQEGLDGLLKETGHENAYFPLLIPMSFIEREKEHVEGFKPELAIVTHAGGKALEEPYVIRPTSETIIYSMYAKWVQSYRDLPLLLNQWCNVMRWEMRTRLFLRTSEFLWQEGHTAHATEEEAREEARLILGIYRKFQEEWIAMPPVTGVKSESEKFAGAEQSYAVEAIMKDNRALQAGTSHFLGRNFSRQFELTFQNKEGREEYAWNTSWGVSTRMVGGMVMTHGDDKGIVIPPRVAPAQVVVVPIWRTETQRAQVLRKADEFRDRLVQAGVRTRVDARDHLSPGAKFYEWDRKGVPFRAEIGPRDLAQGQVVLVRRVPFPDASGDAGKARARNLAARKRFLPLDEAVSRLPALLRTLNTELLEAARTRREENSHREVSELGELKEIMEGEGGLVYTGWSGDPEVEELVKQETRATIRVIPDEEFASSTRPVRCIGGGRARMEVAWARAY